MANIAQALLNQRAPKKKGSLEMRSNGISMAVFSGAWLDKGPACGQADRGPLAGVGRLLTLEVHHLHAHRQVGGQGVEQALHIDAASPGSSRSQRAVCTICSVLKWVPAVASQIWA